MAHHSLCPGPRLGGRRTSTLALLVAVIFIAGGTLDGANHPPTASHGRVSSGMNGLQDLVSEVPSNDSRGFVFTPMTKPAMFGPASGGQDWKFGSIKARGSGTVDAKTIYFNVTTPQSATTHDTVAMEVSSYDNANNYDQAGISGGDWTITQTSAPCSGTLNWCADFSFALAQNFYDCSVLHYYTFEYGPLLVSTKYQLEMAFDNNGYVHGYVFYEGPNNAHSLMNSFKFFTGGTVFTVYPQYSCSGYTFPDFTVYEEVYVTNPVEPWPAFNPHTDVAIMPTNGGSKQLVWATYSEGTLPSGFPGQIVTSYSAGINNVILANEPWASWVGTWFGNGEYVTGVIVPGTVWVPINPLADPTGGYKVYYQYDYCSLPCRDVSFSPTSSTVQPDSQFYSPNANMVATVYFGQQPQAYIMSLYAYDPVSNSYYLTQWILAVY